MAIFTVKRVGLSVVGITTAGGVIKAATGASASDLVPMPSTSELSVPLSSTRFVNEVDREEEVRSRQRRELAKNLNNHQVDYSREINGDEKDKIRAEADNILETLDDYTFKLFGPCGDGTAWILDYVLPERSSQKYPLTWYFATNLHVIGSYRFQNNPYEQELPKPEEETRRLKKEYSGLSYSHWNLWNGPTCQFVDRYGYLDIGLSQSSWGQQHKADYGLAESRKIKIPKLFWTAYNFLEKDESLGIKEDNFVDFAVLEIEFENETMAIRYTGGFADKYDKGKKKPIDVFAAPLESKYSREQLYNLDDNFYLLAYPHKNEDRWSSTNNFSKDNAIASQLSGYKWDVHFDSNEKYRGFVDAKKVMNKKVMWNKKPLQEVGHFYKLKNNPLGLGSSGGVYVDGKGNAVGVTAVTTLGGSGPSWVAPLRSAGFTFEDHGVKVVTPKYDLILGGGEKQKSSYKSQLERFILKDGRKTWLSTREGWNAKPQPKA